MGKLTYTKSREDASREKADLTNDAAIRYLKYKENFKFNIGDIVILEEKRGEEWKPTMASYISKVPIKYIYVFENELGVGYVKQLKSDGSGIGDGLKCVTEFNGAYQRFSLDPDYADHLLLAEPGEEFEYARAHQAKSSFRKKAIAKNKKLLRDFSTPELRIQFIDSLSVGDEVYIGHDWDAVCENTHVVHSIGTQKKSEIHYYSSKEMMTDPAWNLVGDIKTVQFKSSKNKWGSISATVFDVSRLKVLTGKPHTLEDDMSK